MNYGSAATNFGTEVSLRIGEGNGSTNDLNRSLIRFDLSSIPANATITSATLSLWTTNDLSDNDRTIRVYRLKTAFAESSATWNQAASGVSWQSAGASGANDRESTDIGSVLVLANEADGTEKQISLNTAKIQEMVSGTFTNNGFLIIADTELNDRFNYRSSDASTSSQRPKLVIEYTASTPTPGPSPTPTNTPAGPTPTATRTPTPGASDTPTLTAPPAFQSATFVYDGDGKRVKSIFNGTTTTYFVGVHYEVTGSTVTKYYYAGAQRIAMQSNGELKFLLGDHLGSTSLVTDAAGENGIVTRYKAWGEVRYSSGNLPTRHQFTGQYSYELEFGLLFYQARWYDSALGRFAQADTIVPNGVQGWDRYAYVSNNPLRYTDPTGHMEDDGYVGNHRRLDCQKYGQYCNSGKPKSTAELIAMRTPQRPEPPKPWELRAHLNFGIHIGIQNSGSMPDYYGETENSANVPYFPGGNQNPNVCVGRAGALGCLFSFGASLLPYEYGPSNVDDNFFVAFDVNYNEAVGITMTDLHWANQYGGPAVLGDVSINDQVLLQGTSLMPTDGQYRPIPRSGGVYYGLSPISIEMRIMTAVDTPNGPGGFWQNLHIVLPSLPDLRNAQR